jgi:dTDP-4-dehydrorhamnose 3,5-epimerase
MFIFEELEIRGVWLQSSTVNRDNRGFFYEGFLARNLQSDLGREFHVNQVKVSNSKRGVVRGIHSSLARCGQAKLVTCVAGRIWDVAVDLRVNSPTFGKWLGVELDSVNGKSLFIGEGIGHGFYALEEDSSVFYLLSSTYSPNDEIAINPLDPEIAISWPGEIAEISGKDKNAPFLAEMLERLKHGPHIGGN